MTLTELPKTATGKIQKFVLREWARQGGGRRRRPLMALPHPHIP